MSSPLSARAQQTIRATIRGEQPPYSFLHAIDHVFRHEASCDAKGKRALREVRDAVRAFASEEGLNPAATNALGARDLAYAVEQEFGSAHLMPELRYRSGDYDTRVGQLHEAKPADLKLAAETARLLARSAAKAMLIGGDERFRGRCAAQLLLAAQIRGVQNFGGAFARPEDEDEETAEAFSRFTASCPPVGEDYIEAVGATAEAAVRLAAAQFHRRPPRRGRLPGKANAAWPEARLAGWIYAFRLRNGWTMFGYTSDLEGRANSYRNANGGGKKHAPGKGEFEDFDWSAQSPLARRIERRVLYHPAIDRRRSSEAIKAPLKEVIAIAKQELAVAEQEIAAHGAA